VYSLSILEPGNEFKLSRNQNNVKKTLVMSSNACIRTPTHLDRSRAISPSRHPSTPCSRRQTAPRLPTARRYHADAAAARIQPRHAMRTRSTAEILESSFRDLRLSICAQAPAWHPSYGGPRRMLTIRSTPSTHALPPEPRAWTTVAHDTGDVARRRRTRRRTPSASALLRTCASQTLLALAACTSSGAKKHARDAKTWHADPSDPAKHHSVRT